MEVMSTDPASGKLWAMASHVDQDKSFGLQDPKHEWLFLSQGVLQTKGGQSSQAVGTLADRARLRWRTAT